MSRTAPQPSTRDVRAYRNLLYLRNASLQKIGDVTVETERTAAIDSVVKSSRVAVALSNDNARRANLRHDKQQQRLVLQAGQAEANAKWLAR